MCARKSTVSSPTVCWKRCGGKRWLVNDGVATTEEVDDAIRFGAGLRWSFMGTFLIYRMAGGEAGMRHFLAQFGPALKLPWTKLEAPELTEELIDRISAQSDAQAAGASIRDLEARRDDCLIAVLSALRENDFAAGEVVKDYERRLREGAAPPKRRNAMRRRMEEEPPAGARRMTLNTNA